MRHTSLSILAALLALPLVAHATGECSAVDAAIRAFEAELNKPDSDPNALNRLSDAYLAVVGKCLTNDRLVTDEEVKTAQARLEKPIFYVRASDLKVELMRSADGSDVYSIEANVPELGGEKVIATFAIPFKLIDADFPEMHFPNDPNPTVNIKPKDHKTTDGRDARIYIHEDGKIISTTSTTLKALHDAVVKDYEGTLKSNKAILALVNLKNFADEYRELHCVKGMSEKDAQQLAIRTISFGQHRTSHPFCYRRFEVKVTGSRKETITSRDGTTKACEVPTGVTVVASDRRAPCK